MKKLIFAVIFILVPAFLFVSCDDSATNITPDIVKKHKPVPPPLPPPPDKKYKALSKINISTLSGSKRVDSSVALTYNDNGALISVENAPMTDSSDGPIVGVKTKDDITYNDDKTVKSISFYNYLDDKWKLAYKSSVEYKTVGDFIIPKERTSTMNDGNAFEHITYNEYMSSIYAIDSLTGKMVKIEDTPVVNPIYDTKNLKKPIAIDDKDLKKPQMNFDKFKYLFPNDDSQTSPIIIIPHIKFPIILPIAKWIKWIKSNPFKFPIIPIAEWSELVKFNPSGLPESRKASSSSYSFKYDDAGHLSNVTTSGIVPIDRSMSISFDPSGLPSSAKVINNKEYSVEIETADGVVTKETVKDEDDNVIQVRTFEYADMDAKPIMPPLYWVMPELMGVSSLYADKPEILFGKYMFIDPFNNDETVHPM